MSDSDATTLTIESEDGASDQVTLPDDLLDMLAEGDETAPKVVGDLAMFSSAQRIHGAVHHAEGEPDERVQGIESQTMALFEERFGASFEELTGHGH